MQVMGRLPKEASVIDIIAVGSLNNPNNPLHGSLIMLELQRNVSGELCWASVIPNNEEKLSLLKKFIAMRTTCSLETILERLPGVIYIGQAHSGMPYEENHLINVTRNLL